MPSCLLALPLGCMVGTSNSICPQCNSDRPSQTYSTTVSFITGNGNSILLVLMPKPPSHSGLTSSLVTTPSPSANFLGVILQNTSITDHFSPPVTLAFTTIISPPDYCNSLLSWLLAFTLGLQQPILTTAARVIPLEYKARLCHSST